MVRVGNLFGKNKYKPDLKFLLEEGLLKKLQNFETTVHSRRNLTNAIIIGLKVLGGNVKVAEKFRKYLLELNRKVDEQASSGKLTKKQQEKTIPWDQIVKLRKLLAKQLRLSQAMKRKTVGKRDLKLLMEYLAICCMTLHPPTRLDWGVCHFYYGKSIGKLDENTKKTQNYVIIRKSSVTAIWSQYKTVGKYGQLTHELGKPLAKVIRAHCKFLKTVYPKNTALFLNKKAEPMSRSSFQKLLEGLFFRYFHRKGISVSTLRRIYLSDKYSHKAILEAKHDSERMMHSRRTAEKHYIKQGKNE